MPPIRVSSPNASLRTATGTGISLDTKQPFAKLDSTKTVSFQLINILFLHEPPNPSGIGVDQFTSTLVYQFAHGYKYVPSTWFMASLDGMVTSFGTEGSFLQGGGSTPTNSSVILDIEVDESNVSIFIDKYYTAGVGAPLPNILGQTLTIRAYVFVNDVSGTDVPTQA